jgi:hypothetical protein
MTCSRGHHDRLDADPSTSYRASDGRTRPGQARHRGPDRRRADVGDTQANPAGSGDLGGQEQ